MFDRAVSKRAGQTSRAAMVLTEHFGENLGMVLLWNETCFPMDDRIALQQAEYLVSRDKMKRLIGPTGERRAHARTEAE